MQIHKSINIDSLNNVNIYILSEVRAVILFISIYIYLYKREGILLEHRPDVLRSGLVIQVFCGESEEKKEWEWTLVHQ